MSGKMTLRLTTVAVLASLLITGVAGIGVVNAQEGSGPRHVTLGASVKNVAEGAFVLNVPANSPTDAAGILPGDLIVAVNGNPVDAEHPLADRLDAYEAGDTVTLTIIRAGETMILEATLVPAPARTDLADVAGEADEALVRLWMNQMLSQIREHLGALAPDERGLGNLPPLGLSQGLAGLPLPQGQPSALEQNLEPHFLSQVLKAVRNLFGQIEALYRAATVR